MTPFDERLLGMTPADLLRLWRRIKREQWAADPCVQWQYGPTLKRIRAALTIQREDQGRWS